MIILSEGRKEGTDTKGSPYCFYLRGILEKKPLKAVNKQKSYQACQKYELRKGLITKA